MSTHSERIAIRLPLDLLERVQELAERDHEYLSEIIRGLIVDGLDIRKKRRRKRAGTARPQAHGGAAAD